MGIFCLLPSCRYSKGFQIPGSGSLVHKEYLQLARNNFYQAKSLIFINKNYYSQHRILLQIGLFLPELSPCYNSLLVNGAQAVNPQEWLPTYLSTELLTDSIGFFTITIRRVPVLSAHVHSHTSWDRLPISVSVIKALPQGSNQTLNTLIFDLFIFPLQLQHIFTLCISF